MGASLLRATVTLPASDSGLTRDQATNTFWFIGEAGDSLEAQTTEIGLRLLSFYQDENSNGGFAIGKYLSRAVSRTTDMATIMMWDATPLLTAPVPLGPPDRVAAMTIPAAVAGSNLPNEVSVELSIHAGFGDLSSDPTAPGEARPRARRRGRIYIGPLLSACSSADSTATGVPRVSNGFGIDLKVAADDLLAKNSEEDVAIFWAVFSRADLAARTVVETKVDNELDTQRRRGRRPSADFVLA